MRIVKGVYQRDRSPATAGMIGTAACRTASRVGWPNLINAAQRCRVLGKGIVRNYGRHGPASGNKNQNVGVGANAGILRTHHAAFWNNYSALPRNNRCAEASDLGLLPGRLAPPALVA